MLRLVSCDVDGTLTASTDTTLKHKEAVFHALHDLKLFFENRDYVLCPTTGRGLKHISQLYYDKILPNADTFYYAVGSAAARVSNGIFQPDEQYLNDSFFDEVKIGHYLETLEGSEVFVFLQQESEQIECRKKSYDVYGPEDVLNEFISGIEGIKYALSRIQNKSHLNYLGDRSPDLREGYQWFHLDFLRGTKEDAVQDAARHLEDVHGQKPQKVIVSGDTLNDRGLVEGLLKLPKNTQKAIVLPANADEQLVRVARQAAKIDKSIDLYTPNDLYAAQALLSYLTK
jgi:hydroxymethylpyrimidine pyrophosphatase-like HAD family hydrolase